MDRPRDLTIDEVSVESSELARRFLAKTGAMPKLQQMAPNPGVMGFVNELFFDEVRLQRGDLLSSVMRLPDALRNAAMEYLSKSRPYDGVNLDVRVTLRNISSNAVRVRDHAQVVAIPSRVDGSVDGGVHTTVTHDEVLEPGEEIDLNVHWAVNALRRFGRNAMPAYALAVAGSSSGDRTLAEVGYRVSFFDMSDLANPQMRSADSRAWAAAKAAGVTPEPQPVSESAPSRKRRSV